MSKYLTLIPLLREMCFPYHHSCLGEEKKKITILENGNFYVFSFGNWANVIWVMKMNSCIPLQFHSSSSICFCPPSIPFLCKADCMCPPPMEKADSIRSPCFFYLFYIYFCLSGQRQDGRRFHLTGSITLLPRLSGFSPSPFQAYSSQYLPVLSKCYCKVFQWDDSKYVYINRGNTLGYILLTLCVAWSLYRLLLFQPNLSIWRVIETCISF